jgi:hypothetical protein
MAALNDSRYAIDKLAWMQAERIWPNGLRYLWTDAFGVVLLVSLFTRTGERQYLDGAERVVADVERVLGRERGIRIGEAPDRHGQYFHYLAMWLYALAVLARHLPDYRDKGVALARAIHDPFVVPGRGVHWKMAEDLSRPYPGIGFGAIDAFHGYVAYRALDAEALAPQIAQMRDLIARSAASLDIAQDLGLGMMLWIAHFCPDEDWAALQRARCLRTLDSMWRPEGFFCRTPLHPELKFAFTNYGVAVGLQATGAMPERVPRLNAFFETWRSGDEYDREAITHVMACSAHFPGHLVRDFG